MAQNKIQIKRSVANSTVTGLSNGELAFTANGNILYIGDPAGGAAIPIGGKFNYGTLTANQAIVTNSTSGIDKVIVANLVPTNIWANGAAGTNGQYLTSNASGGVYWYTPAPGVVGSDTQVQFNDGGSLGADAGLTFNKTTDLLTTGKLAVANTTASTNTTTGAATVAGGLGVNGRINVTDMAIGNDSVYATVNNSVIGTNNLFATGTVNGSVLSVGGWVIANNSGVFTSGGVNGSVIGVGTQFSVNTTQVSISQGMKLSANGALGSANQVLRTDASGTAYWSDDNGDISAVTAGNGLTGGGTSGAVTLDVGAGNGISVSADAIAVTAGSGLVSNATGVHIVTSGDSTLIANSSGLFVNDATLSIASSQLSSDVALGTQTSGNYVATITAGSGISGSATGEGSTPTIAVVANNGITSNSSGVFVNGGSTLTVNSVGAHVNSTLQLTSLSTTGDVTVNGNTKLGDASSDVVSFIASVNTSINPSANVTYSVGTNNLRWSEVHAQNVHSTVGYFDGSVQVGGDLVVFGNVTTTNVASVIVSDPMIYLAGNNYSSDLVDIGLAANYFDGATNRHTGLFRDASDSGIWKLFQGSEQELSGNNLVNTAANGFTLAILQSYLQSGALTSNATSVYITANSTVNVNITANTLTLSSPLSGTSGGTGKSTVTSQAILVGNTTNGYNELTLGTTGYVLQSNGTAIVYDTLDGGTF